MHKDHATKLALAAIWLGLACASSPLSGLRLQNRPPVTELDDARPIPKPEKRDPGPLEQQADQLVRAPLDHALEVAGALFARDVNALDEVPRSSWFTPRIGVRALSAQDIARGPSTNDAERDAPFHVLSMKDEGTAPGLMVRGASGTRYLLKIDVGGLPEAETGAEIVVQRLLWALGYHVPDNSVAYLARNQLVVEDGAKRKTADGESLPLRPRDVDTVLDAAAHAPDGRARVLLSTLLEGKPIGGYAMRGVRPDDPNDRIPHEHRRSVRALRLIFAWLGQTDVKETNTLDMWIEQGDSGLGVVRHNLIDFGKSLGVWGRQGRERDGYAPHFDFADATRALFGFGLVREPWEDLHAPALRGVGRFESSRFDPADYSPANPYLPFLYADRLDDYWAAKLIARFTREHLAAAVEAARYSDPRAREYLVATLRARQRIAVAFGFWGVSSLEEVHLRAGGVAHVQLCARDLAIAYGFDASDARRYRVQAYDRQGRVLGAAQSLTASADGELCAEYVPVATTKDRYTLIAIETQLRGGRSTSMIVHLGGAPVRGGLRVIGLERH